jgi:hypothetical protein
MQHQIARDLEHGIADEKDPGPQTACFTNPTFDRSSIDSANISAREGASRKRALHAAHCAF